MCLRNSKGSCVVIVQRSRGGIVEDEVREVRVGADVKAFWAVLRILAFVLSAMGR